jgi:hypothetical protein
MKVLLDECLPHDLRLRLPGHDVMTAKYAKCSGMRNGELLAFMKDRVEVFITTDRNLEHQQRLDPSGPAIVVLIVPDNDATTILPTASRIVEAIGYARPGQIIYLKHEG